MAELADAADSKDREPDRQGSLSQSFLQLSLSPSPWLMRVNVGLLRHDRHRTVIACAPGGGPKHPYPVFKTGTSVSRDLKNPQVFRASALAQSPHLLAREWASACALRRVDCRRSFVLIQSLYLAFTSVSSEPSSHSRSRA